MDCKDLMIGDWVKEIAIDDSILTGSSEVQIDLSGLRLCAEGMVKLKPIPLTEDILKANGFVISDLRSRRWIKYGDSQKFLYIEYRLTETQFWCVNNKHHDVRILINYVHELQHALRLCGLNELADNFNLKAIKE